MISRRSFTTTALAASLLVPSLAVGQTIRCNPGEDDGPKAPRCGGQLEFNASICASQRPAGVFTPGAPHFGDSFLPPGQEVRPGRGRGQVQSRRRGTLRIAGSTTVRPSSDRYETYYRLRQPSVSFEKRALGSTTGIRGLIEGACAERLGLDPTSGLGAICDQNGDGEFESPLDVGQASRPMRNIELARANDAGLCINEYPVALDGLGIVVNPEVAACSGEGAFLTQSDIEDIYLTDTITDWGLIFPGCAGLPVEPVSRTREGGTFGAFVDLYLDGDDPSGGTFDPFSPENPSMTHVGSNDEIVNFVSANDGGVGFAGIAFIAPNAADGLVHNMPVTRSLAVPAAPATFETVATGQFQFSRFLFNYTAGVPAPESLLGDYLQGYLGILGQVATFDSGFVPVQAIKPIEVIAQTYGEGVGQELFELEKTRIQEKLAIIEQAEETIADPGSSPGEVRDATTDKAESEFAIEEFIAADTGIVTNAWDRVSDACPGAPGLAEAAEHLDEAETAFEAAEHDTGMNALIQALTTIQRTEVRCR